MVMAMFDFEASSSTSTKSTIISKKDASGFDEAKTNDTYQKGISIWGNMLKSYSTTPLWTRN